MAQKMTYKNNLALAQQGSPWSTRFSNRKQGVCSTPTKA